MVDAVKQRVELGKAIARMYIASQEVNRVTSDLACQAMEDACTAMCFGFDIVMDSVSENPKRYPTRARAKDSL